VNEHLHGVHLGLLLCDQSHYPMCSRTMEGVTIGRGMLEIRYTPSYLPILPGVYTWRIRMYDSNERVDDWECIPNEVCAGSIDPDSR
jgi:hypothetical protein